MPTVDSFVDWLMKLEGLLPAILVVIAITLAVLFISIAALNILNVLRVRRGKFVCLEITPPANRDKTPVATTQLFNVLYGFQDSRSLLRKVLRSSAVISLEVVSTRKQGIRFIIRVPESEATNYEHSILAYAPDAKLKRVEDYLPGDIRNKSSVITFRQSGHFAYPLQELETLDLHDPIAYLGSTMTKLHDSDLVAFQLVASPVRHKGATILQNRLTHNELLVTSLDRQNIPAAKLLGGLSSVLFWFTDAIGDMFHGPSRTVNYSAQRRQEVATKIKPARSLSPIEQALADSVQYKLNQPLFRVEIRALVITENRAETKQRLSGLRQAIGSLSVPRYQSLKKRLPYPGSRRIRTNAFQYRLPSVWTKSTSILAASELATLYHFPHSQTGKTENVVTSLSKQLPAPVSLKNGTKLDVVLGENIYHSQSTPIGLTADERERHVYVIGGTGNGKTTMLFYSILQDIRAGKGVAVIDPHGDLADRILRYIPENRLNDVVYMNPDDLSHPIGVNLLELPEGLSGDDLLREKDLVTESTISVLRKIFSDDDSGGHRIEYVLRNSIQTALTIEGSTLFTIFELLNDAKYRRKVVKSLTDKNLIDFWNNELGKAGEFQRVKMAAGITAKIGRFLFSASAKRVLEQPKSTIDFDKILLDQKILICNFSKGLLGEDTSALFGTTILAKLQTAALRRARLSDKQRTPYFLYVDEFQNFATMSFVQMLSEARKYKLLLTMAEQSTSQQDQQRLVDIILANVGTIVCFRSGSPADERLVLPLFKPFLQEGEIGNLPAYSYYVRIAAVNAQEPMSGMTLVVEDTGSEITAQKVLALSRQRYSKDINDQNTVEPAKKPNVSKPTKRITKSNHSSKKAKGGLAEAASLE